MEIENMRHKLKQRTILHENEIRQSMQIELTLSYAIQSYVSYKLTFWKLH